MNTRRQFLIQAPLGLAGALAACRGTRSAPEPQPTTSAATPSATPGAPPAFNTAPPVGPEVSVATFAEAEKLMQVQMSDAERRMAAGSWRTSMAAMLERRTGPRTIALAPTLAPATRWEPGATGEFRGPTRDRFVRSTPDAAPLPTNDADIAFAPVTRLSHWVETRALSSERLTRIYLERLQRFDPTLRCVITLTLIGRLFDEGTIARAGLALERSLGVVAKRPPGF